MSSEPLPLTWTLEEIQAVDTVLYGALAELDKDAAEDLELARQVLLLRSARSKLARVAPQGLCAWCAERGRRGNSRYCKRCETYKHKYGYFPSEETLKKSAARKDRSRP